MHNPPLILVVDDSRADALLLAGTLRNAGYAVDVAQDGQAAIGTCREKVPDLIMLDMTLPGLSGADTCRAIRAEPATVQVPIVFVTAHSDTEHVVQAFNAGGSDYVTKPIRTAEILTRISVQLRLREAEQSLLERNVQLEALAAQLSETNSELALQSRIDGLTGLLNRRAWDQAATLEEDRSQRHDHPYSVLLIDVDHFKRFNDSLGHQEGDHCLQKVAQSISNSCRTTDVVARYGGEEFVILAPETPASSAVILAERVRQSVWSLSMRHPDSPAGRVTVSIGVAGNDEGRLTEVLRAADTFLYRAKDSGRNLVFARHSGAPGLGAEHDGLALPAVASGEAALARNPTVLLVEDNRTNRMVYRGCLEKQGFSIIEVENGAAALSAVHQHPDVILMDVMMPVMDGIECTRLLKSNEETRDIPIIIVSARDDSASVLAGLEAGAEEYLTKPVRTIELAARVRSMIRLGNEKRDLLRSYRLRAEQIRFLTGLVDLCQAIGNARTVEEVMDHTIRAAAEITGSRRVSVLVPSQDRQTLTVCRALGFDVQDSAEQRIPIGQDVAGRAFATQETVVVNPPRPDTQATEPAAEACAGVPLLAIPLGDATPILGVLNVTGRLANRAFEAQELEYVDLIARIAGSAMHTLRNRQERDEARDQIVIALARLAEHRDDETGRHVERVTRYSCVLAEALRRRGCFTDTIDDRFIGDLTRSVPLHDIGKVAIPDSILLKPARLSLEEMRIMRTHVDTGVETLRPIVNKAPGSGFLGMALDIIRAHHEWFDGSGYPNRLEREAIPLSARIVAVADVYDALTTNRVYRAAMSFAEAEQVIIDGSGTHFDPAVVEVFRESRDLFRKMALEMKERCVPEAEAPHGAVPNP